MINKYIGTKETHPSLDTLKLEMSQYLQIDNLNFLLGAGCSSHLVDDSEKGIPVMGTLYEDFFIEGNRKKEFLIASENAYEKFKPIGYNGNLERMLEVMQAIEVVSDLKGISIELEGITDKINIVKSFIKDRIKTGISSKEVNNTYKQFYMKTVRKSRHSPINIFTTNYDLYSEKALDELSFPYNNGFTGTYKRTFNPASYNYAYVEDMDLSKNYWERVPNFFNIFKLHGSISWFKNKGKIYERDFTQIDSPKESNVMIYPTPLKDRTTLMVPYSDLFRKMENTLIKRNSILITIGYSFADDHINRLIFNSLANPTFRLIIFGSSQYIDEIKNKNDPRIIIINSTNNDDSETDKISNLHYFYNIVDYIMPDIDSDIMENEEIQSRNKKYSETIANE